MSAATIGDVAECAPQFAPSLLINIPASFVDQNDDLVWDLNPEINAGSGEVIFYMYIPSTDDAGAYNGS